MALRYTARQVHGDSKVEDQRQDMIEWTGQPTLILSENYFKFAELAIIEISTN